MRRKAPTEARWSDTLVTDRRRTMPIEAQMFTASEPVGKHVDKVTSAYIRCVVPSPEGKCEMAPPAESNRGTEPEQDRNHVAQAYVRRCVVQAKDIRGKGRVKVWWPTHPYTPKHPIWRMGRNSQYSYHPCHTSCWCRYMLTTSTTTTGRTWTGSLQTTLSGSAAGDNWRPSRKFGTTRHHKAARRRFT